MPTVDLFIRSYHRDLRRLSRTLASLTFLIGYREIVIVVPESTLDRADVSAVAAAPRVRLLPCPDHPDGDYLGQQVTKLHADRYTDAEVIMHLDSDQSFVAPCDLRTELFDPQGRPRIGVGSRRPPADPWRRCPADFFGREFAYDLATPPPLALPRHVYATLRASCRTRHGMSIAGYARRATAARFSEHALLRAQALVAEPDAYQWVDVTDRDLIPQCWTSFSRAAAAP